MEGQKGGLVTGLGLGRGPERAGLVGVGSRCAAVGGGWVGAGGREGGLRGGLLLGAPAAEGEWVVME